MKIATHIPTLQPLLLAALLATGCSKSTPIPGLDPCSDQERDPGTEVASGEPVIGSWTADALFAEASTLLAAVDVDWAEYEDATPASDTLGFRFSEPGQARFYDDDLPSTHPACPAIDERRLVLPVHVEVVWGATDPAASGPAELLLNDRGALWIALPELETDVPTAYVDALNAAMVTEADEGSVAEDLESIGLGGGMSKVDSTRTLHLTGYYSWGTGGLHGCDDTPEAPCLSVPWVDPAGP